MIDDRRLRSLLLALCLLPVAGRSARAQALFVETPTVEGPADVVDLWLINGNAIGNAVGAVVGQMAFAGLFGPAGWVVGSVVGGVAGGLVGEWADNQVHGAYNYAAFDRPALGEPGSVVLEDAGPMEQLLYQVNSRVLIGGNIATLVTHFGINLLLRTLPGGAALINPLALGVADYLAGAAGDNLDGMMDLSAIGAQLDRGRGIEPGGGETASWEVYSHDPPGPKELYDATLRALRGDEVRNRREVRRSWSAYAGGGEDR